MRLQTRIEVSEVLRTSVRLTELLSRYVVQLSEGVDIFSVPEELEPLEAQIGAASSIAEAVFTFICLATGVDVSSLSERVAATRAVLKVSEVLSRGREESLRLTDAVVLGVGAGFPGEEEVQTLLLKIQIG